MDARAANETRQVEGGEGAAAGNEVVLEGVWGGNLSAMQALCDKWRATPRTKSPNVTQ